MKTKVLFILLFVTAFGLFPANAADVQSGEPVQDKNSLKYVLEHFCLDLFDACFEKCEYIEGSLIVENYELKDGVYMVSGSHSYWGYHGGKLIRKKHEGVFFEAEVTKISDNEYIVMFKTFWSHYLPGRDGEWLICKKHFWIK